MYNIWDEHVRKISSKLSFSGYKKITERTVRLLDLNPKKFNLFLREKQTSKFFCFQNQNQLKPIVGRTISCPDLRLFLIHSQKNRKAEPFIIINEILNMLEIYNFTLSIGDNDFVNGLLNEEINDGINHSLKKAILHKNIVDFNALVNPCKSELLKKIFNLHSLRIDELNLFKEMINNESSKQVLGKMGYIYDILEKFRASKNVYFDLSLLIPECNGIGFEYYFPHVGYPVIKGKMKSDLFTNNGSIIDIEIRLKELIDCIKQESFEKVILQK